MIPQTLNADERAAQEALDQRGRAAAVLCLLRDLLGGADPADLNLSARGLYGLTVLLEACRNPLDGSSSFSL